MGTAFTASYQLIDGSRKLSTKTNVAEEGNFVVRKLNWALSNISSISSPSSGTSSSLTLTQYDGNIVYVKLNGTKIEMKEKNNGNTFTPITTYNVSVSSLEFTYIDSSGGAPAGITASTVINGVTFTITKYIRK
jgi:hypothetical protein